MLDITPSQLGFYMPAEWEKHAATWMAWPYDLITFPRNMQKVKKIFASIIYHLHLTGRVELLVLDEVMKTKVEKILKSSHVDTNKIMFHLVDYADVWMRDYGPTFLVNQNREKFAWIKWKYNAYGEKFVNLLKDNETPYKIADYIDQPMFEAGMVMEGGAIDVNGKGSLITTEECLLNVNRNPNLDKQQIENKLKDCLGVNNIIWLKQGIVGDQTDGHIDEVARFVNENTIVFSYEEDKNDPNFKILDDNLQILQNATDQNGKPFNLIKLPLPRMNYDNGKRAPVSYTNFYMANELILIPQFQHKNDKIALSILQTLFPDREAIGIDCEDVIYGGGAVHCITQQQPWC
jgi:agmatine deiminase